MPAPAVYVVAVLASVAAGVAFHQFVYEPHIAPKIEVWAETFLANRAEKRRKRESVSVSVSAAEDHDESPLVPRGASIGGGSARKDGRDSSTYELENMISKEVDEWRTEVQRSQGASLRHRKTSGGASRAQVDMNYVPMSPTHVVFDSSCPPTPSTTRSAHLRATSQRNANAASGRLPTPDPSVAPGSPVASAHRNVLSNARQTAGNEAANVNVTSPIPADLELLSHRSASPFSVVYASSSASAQSQDEDDRPLGLGMVSHHPLMNPAVPTQQSPENVTSSYILPSTANTNTTYEEALSEPEFLTSTSSAGSSSVRGAGTGAGNAGGASPFSDTEDDDMFSVSSRDDFDVGSVSSWASARASSARS